MSKTFLSESRTWFNGRCNVVGGEIASVQDRSLVLTRNTHTVVKIVPMLSSCRSRWPCGLKRTSEAIRLLKSRIWISLGTWRFVSCDCFVGRSLCDGPISRLGDSHWVCVSHCMRSDTTLAFYTYWARKKELDWTESKVELWQNHNLEEVVKYQLGNYKRLVL
jgi:hypothetical protein